MLNIKIICVGKLKEKFYIDAVNEYAKRLSTYCRLEIEELAEEKRSSNPSESEVAAALTKEAENIKSKIPRSSYVVSMCIEGKKLSSEKFSKTVSDLAVAGLSKLCFIIGGSDGLDKSIKDMSNMCLSMSDMTFPHHLARVMLLEQIYRAFKIAEGGKYHK